MMDKMLNILLVEDDEVDVMNVKKAFKKRLPTTCTLYIRTGVKSRERPYTIAKKIYPTIPKGEIPSGYEIHHKDFDVDNNDIKNLQCIRITEHRKLHAQRNMQNEEYVRRNQKRIDEENKNIPMSVIKGMISTYQTIQPDEDFNNIIIQRSLSYVIDVGSRREVPAL
jgi:hypothetical protein